MVRRASASRRPVELDLAVDLGSVEDRPLDDRPGRTSAIPCLTAVMFVIAPPIPTSASGAGARRAATRSAAIAASASSQRLVVDRPVEAEPLGEPDRPDRDAELLLDAAGVAERELRAAAAGVEDVDPTLDRAEAGPDGEIGEPAFLLAGDHLDADAGPLLDPERRRRAFAAGAAPPCRPRRSPARLLAAPPRPCRDRVARPVERRGLDLAARVEPLAQPRDLGPVDDGSPGAVRGALADVELHRVRSDIDHRVARRDAVEQRDQARRVARVQVVRRGRATRRPPRPRPHPSTRPRSSRRSGRPRRAPTARPCSRRPCTGPALVDRNDRCARSAASSLQTPPA